jgi:hypothetical protein
VAVETRAARTAKTDFMAAVRSGERLERRDKLPKEPLGRERTDIPFDICDKVPKTEP